MLVGRNSIAGISARPLEGGDRTFCAQLRSGRGNNHEVRVSTHHAPPHCFSESIRPPFPDRGYSVTSHNVFDTARWARFDALKL